MAPVRTGAGQAARREARPSRPRPARRAAPRPHRRSGNNRAPAASGRSSTTASVAASAHRYQPGIAAAWAAPVANRAPHHVTAHFTTPLPTPSVGCAVASWGARSTDGVGGRLVGCAVDRRRLPGRGTRRPARPARSAVLSTTLENEAIATLENEATQTDWMGDLGGGLGVDPAAGRGWGAAAAGRSAIWGSGGRRWTGRWRRIGRRSMSGGRWRRRSRRSRRGCGRCWRSIRRCRRR